MDIEKLQEALDYFDVAINDVVGHRYENINGMQLAIHYNQIRNSLALFMKEHEDKEEIE